MAAISYGTITITDITDIINVYLEYCMAADTYTSAAAIQAKTTWTSPEVDWSTTYPTWQSGYQIWIRQVQQKEGVEQLEYGTPYLDKAINQTNENLVRYIETQGLTLDALNTKTRFMWRNQNPHTHGVDDWAKPDYLVGTYAASGIQQGNKFIIDYENSDTYGFNTYLNHNSLNLRYNAIKFTELNTSALLFYYPKKDLSLTGAQYVQGESGIKLDVNGLKLYGKYEESQEPDTSNPLGPEHETILAKRLAAELTQNGLTIKNGSIVLGGNGTSGVNAGDIALSNQDFTRTINNTSREHLRMAIGSKFGVKNDGTLYAAGAEIDGSIIARSLTIYDNGNAYTVETLSNREISKYITSIDSNNGIQIHAVNNPGLNYTQIDSNGMEIFKTNGESTASPVSVAIFSDTIRLGKSGEQHMNISPRQITLLDANSEQLAYFSATAARIGKATVSYVDFTDSYINFVRSTDGTLAGRVSLNYISSDYMRIGAAAEHHILINSSGMEVFKKESGDSSPISVASFGSTVRVGQSGASRVVADSVGIRAYNNLNDTVLDLGQSSSSMSYYRTILNRYMSSGTSITITLPQLADETEINISCAVDTTIVSDGFYTGTSSNGTVNHITYTYNGATTLTLRATSACYTSVVYHVTGYAPAWTLGYRFREIGGFSTTIGLNCIASEVYSTAIGFSAGALGERSFAQGYKTTAKGLGSFVTGLFTEADGDNQMVIGKNNSIDTTSAFIIGNGTTSSSRSNALTVDWNGNVVANSFTGTLNGNATTSNVSVRATYASYYSSDTIGITAYSTNEINFVGKSTANSVYIGYRKLESPAISNYYFCNSTTNSNGRGNIYCGTLNATSMTTTGTVSATDVKINNTSLIYIVATGTSGSWRYVKWSDGRVELWGWFSQSVSAYAANAFVIGSTSVTAYPFTITEPKTIVSGQKINNGGCYVSYDYGRTDYWSGIANPTVGVTIAQGTTATVTWTCYVNARWK